MEMNTMKNWQNDYGYLADGHDKASQKQLVRRATMCPAPGARHSADNQADRFFGSINSCQTHTYSIIARRTYPCLLRSQPVVNPPLPPTTHHPSHPTIHPTPHHPSTCTTPHHHAPPCPVPHPPLPRAPPIRAQEAFKARGVPHTMVGLNVKEDVRQRVEAARGSSADSLEDFMATYMVRKGHR